MNPLIHAVELKEWDCIELLVPRALKLGMDETEILFGRSFESFVGQCWFCELLVISLVSIFISGFAGRP